MQHKPTFPELVELFLRVRKLLDDIVSDPEDLSDEQTEELVRVDTACDAMLRRLGHDPVSIENKEAGDALTAIFAARVAPEHRDEVHAAINRMLQAAVATTVQNSAGAVIRRLSQQGVLRMNQDAETDVQDFVRMVLSEEVR